MRCDAATAPEPLPPKPDVGLTAAKALIGSEADLVAAELDPVQDSFGTLAAPRVEWLLPNLRRLLHAAKISASLAGASARPGLLQARRGEHDVCHLARGRNRHRDHRQGHAAARAGPIIGPRHQAWRAERPNPRAASRRCADFRHRTGVPGLARDLTGSWFWCARPGQRCGSDGSKPACGQPAGKCHHACGGKAQGQAADLVAEA
jgi:hypothetical protein